jgi:HlyD family secretion protein
VRVGANATVKAWGGPPVAAQVTRVEPAGFTKVLALGIEEHRVRTNLRGNAEALPWLWHEFRIFVKINIYQAQDALQVPISALFHRGVEWAVFVVEDGRARATPIDIGHRNANLAEVAHGLKQGDVVVLHPSDRVSDGVRVAAGTP